MADDAREARRRARMLKDVVAAGMRKDEAGRLHQRLRAHSVPTPDAQATDALLYRLQGGLELQPADDKGGAGVGNEAQSAQEIRELLRPGRLRRQREVQPHRSGLFGMALAAAVDDWRTTRFSSWLLGLMLAGIAFVIPTWFGLDDSWTVVAVSPLLGVAVMAWLHASPDAAMNRLERISYLGLLSVSAARLLLTVSGVTALVMAGSLVGLVRPEISGQLGGMMAAWLAPLLFCTLLTVALMPRLGSYQAAAVAGMVWAVQIVVAERGGGIWSLLALPASDHWLTAQTVLWCGSALLAWLTASQLAGWSGGRLRNGDGAGGQTHG